LMKKVSPVDLKPGYNNSLEQNNAFYTYGHQTQQLKQKNIFAS